MTIVIKGTANGNDASAAEHFGFVAEQVSAFKSGGSKLALTGGRRNDLAGFPLGAADLRVRQIS